MEKKPENKWPSEQKDIVEIFRSRLEAGKDSSSIVDDFEQLSVSIWNFVAQMLGDVGAKAVLIRSIQLASKDTPLLNEIRVEDKGVDLTSLRNKAQSENLSPVEVIYAFLNLGVMIFKTLTDLTGEALTGPLLRRLEEGK